MKVDWLFALPLIPSFTEVLENGRLPSSLRELITDAVMTVVMLGVVVYLRRFHKQLSVLSLEDSLTGLKNRRCFDSDLESCVARSQRLDLLLTLAFVDIDYFKGINDQHGHERGDCALQDIARLLEGSVRQATDAVYRIGGDEFAILMSCRDEYSVEDVRMRLAEIETAGNGILSPLGASLSIGIAVLDRKDMPQDFLLRADKLMYDQKRIHHCRPHGSIERQKSMGSYSTKNDQN